MIRLDPLPAGLMDTELERRLATALEYEGWQEAETVYALVHPALATCESKFRARALMDHAQVLRRLGKDASAETFESEAERVMGQAIEREEAPKSSVDVLKESQPKKKGLLGRIFGK